VYLRNFELFVSCLIVTGSRERRMRGFAVKGQGSKRIDNDLKLRMQRVT